MQTNEIAVQAAVDAAEKWLALVDVGDYVESWNQTSSLFKSDLQMSSLFRSSVSQQQWQSSLCALQTQVGKVESREVKSKRGTEELPGAPEGKYVVLEYETCFESNTNAREVVTMKKDQDGEWRASDYHFMLILR